MGAMDELHDAYTLLNLKPGAAPDAVKRAFREQVAACHPDRFAADAAMQLRAEEMLRRVIEAHQRIMAQQASSGERGGGAHVRIFFEPGWHGSWGAFFAATPNLVFLALCLTCALLATNRFGMSARAATFTVEVGLIPLFFALAFNLTARKSPVVKNLYLGFSLLALIVVVVDGAVSVNDQGDVGGDRERSVYDSPGGESAGHRRRDTLGMPGFAAEGASEYRTTAPRAPLAPRAPAAPAAPLAPVAPVVMPAR